MEEEKVDRKRKYFEDHSELQSHYNRSNHDQVVYSFVTKENENITIIKAEPEESTADAGEGSGAGPPQTMIGASTSSSTSNSNSSSNSSSTSTSTSNSTSTSANSPTFESDSQASDGHLGRTPGGSNHLERGEEALQPGESSSSCWPRSVATGDFNKESTQGESVQVKKEREEFELAHQKMLRTSGSGWTDAPKTPSTWDYRVFTESAQVKEEVNELQSPCSSGAFSVSETHDRKVIPPTQIKIKSKITEENVGIRRANRRKSKYVMRNCENSTVVCEHHDILKQILKKSCHVVISKIDDRIKMESGSVNLSPFEIARLVSIENRTSLHGMHENSSNTSTETHSSASPTSSNKYKHSETCLCASQEIRETTENNFSSIHCEDQIGDYSCDWPQRGCLTNKVLKCQKRKGTIADMGVENEAALDSTCGPDEAVPDSWRKCKKARVSSDSDCKKETDGMKNKEGRTKSSVNFMQVLLPNGEKGVVISGENGEKQDLTGTSLGSGQKADLESKQVVTTEVVRQKDPVANEKIRSNAPSPLTLDTNVTACTVKKIKPFQTSKRIHLQQVSQGKSAVSSSTEVVTVDSQPGSVTAAGDVLQKGSEVMVKKTWSGKKWVMPEISDLHSGEMKVKTDPVSLDERLPLLSTDRNTPTMIPREQLQEHVLKHKVLEADEELKKRMSVSRVKSLIAINAVPTLATSEDTKPTQTKRPCNNAEKPPSLQQVLIPSTAKEGTSVIVTPVVIPHASRKLNSKTSKSVVNVLTCLYCGKRFPQFIRFKLHMKTHLDGKPIICGDCNESFYFPSSLPDHFNKTHKEDFRFSCSICREEFWRENISSHLLQHENKKTTFRCGVCNKMFSKGKAVIAHMAIHEKQMSYRCGECSIKFENLTDLEAHIKIHFEDGQLKCDMCDKKFRTAVEFSEHAKIHCNPLPYLCNGCGERMKNRSEYNYHRYRCDKGPQPFKCKNCVMVFDSVIEFEAHDAEMHPFHICNFCGVHFRAKKDLAEHLRTHDVVAHYL